MDNNSIKQAEHIQHSFTLGVFLTIDFQKTQKSLAKK